MDAGKSPVGAKPSKVKLTFNVVLVTDPQPEIGAEVDFVRPSGPVTVTSRPLETSTPASPGLAALDTPEPSLSSNTWPETVGPSAKTLPGSIAARRAGEHVTPGQSRAMMLKHSSPPICLLPGNRPGMTQS
jgi:hypothetical protein